MPKYSSTPACLGAAYNQFCAARNQLKTYHCQVAAGKIPENGPTRFNLNFYYFLAEQAWVAEDRPSEAEVAEETQGTRSAIIQLCALASEGT